MVWGLHNEIIGCDEPDGIQRIIFDGAVHGLLQQLVNIPFCYRTCQQTCFWASAPGHISPADEYYRENGVELDNVCHRVKHLRRNKKWAAVNIMLKTQRMLVVELNSFTHIIWLLSRPQDVLARALDKPNFHIVNLLLVIHGQYQGFAVGVYGAVSYQKCSILMWFMWVTNEDQFR